MLYSTKNSFDQLAIVYIKWLYEVYERFIICWHMNLNGVQEIIEYQFLMQVFLKQMMTYKLSIAITCQKF